MEYIELIMKSAPVYNKVYWNVFIYKSRMSNKLEPSLYIVLKTGANFAFYEIAPALI